MMEAATGAAVFLEDADLYETSMDLFAKRVPAYIYLTSDGSHPVAGREIDDTVSGIVDFWYNQKDFQASGSTQETCRDLAHTSYGIASISHVAETSRIQGTDLWQTNLGSRIEAALELHSPFVTGEKAVPSWLCGGSLERTLEPSKFPPKVISQAD